MSIDTSGVPALIAYTRPFRLVVRDDLDLWAPTLEELNNSEYDYVRLCRLSTSFDVGLPFPLCCHIGFDGSLVLPCLEIFQTPQDAVVMFNQIIGQMLLGGFFCEAVGTEDVDRAVLYETGYVRAFGTTNSFSVRLHADLRSRTAGVTQVITLYKPASVTARQMHHARNIGKEILEQVPILSVLFVVIGVSAYSKRDWLQALSNLWVAIEQLLAFLWEDRVINNEDHATVEIMGRHDLLKDVRTWTSSTQGEVFFQTGEIDELTYNQLRIAKAARNKLVHKGTLPDEGAAKAALVTFCRMLSRIRCGQERYEEFDGIIEHCNILSTSESSAKNEKVPVSEMEGLWLGPLPPLPGEKNWGDKPFEKVFGPLEEERKS